MDALANGLPVLIPDRDNPSIPAVPTAQVALWVAVIERLWDDPEFGARYRALALAGAARWDADRLIGCYDVFFRSLVREPDGRTGASARPGRVMANGVARICHSTILINKQ